MKHLKSAIHLGFGITFVYAGLYKFFPFLPVPAFIASVQQSVILAFSDLPWVMPLLAAVEIIGGLLFLIPRSRAFGAVMLLPVVVGILLHNITVDPRSLFIAIGVSVVECWVLICNRHHYKHVFDREI